VATRVPEKICKQFDGLNATLLFIISFLLVSYAVFLVLVR
jgi:hypothetical protein